MQWYYLSRHWGENVNSSRPRFAPRGIHTIILIVWNYESSIEQRYCTNYCAVSSTENEVSWVCEKPKTCNNSRRDNSMNFLSTKHTREWQKWPTSATASSPFFSNLDAARRLVHRLRRQLIDRRWLTARQSISAAESRSARCCHENECGGVGNYFYSQTDVLVFFAQS